MTDEEMVKHLHGMVDLFADMLNNPLLAGTLPTLSVTHKTEDPNAVLRLTVGAEFSFAEHEMPKGGK